MLGNEFQQKASLPPLGHGTISSSLSTWHT
jgi:hypothetical protein